MKAEIPKWVLFLGGCAVAVCVTVCYCTQGEYEPVIKFQSYPMPPGRLAEVVDIVGEAVDFEKWPQSPNEAYRVAPPVDKSLLSRPLLVTKEVSTYTYVPLRPFPGGECNWRWRRVVDGNEPLPTELPAERKEKILEHLPPEKRNDPNLVGERLKRALERHREFKKHRFEGEVFVQLCVAPNCRGAQEYMLAVMTASNMQASAIASLYHKGPEGLGTVSFLHPRAVMFVRDNIFVRIRVQGCFAEEALSLAQKLDVMLLKQTVLTHEKLLARRPLIVIASRADESSDPELKTVPYEASVPKGQEFANVRVYVDDRLATAKDGKIYIVGKKQGKVKVKLSATTKELLCSTVEQEVIIAD